MISPELKSLKNEISHWRATRERQGAIPEGILQEAAEVCRYDGVTKVASALGINPTRLRGVIQGKDGKKPISKGSTPKKSLDCGELRIVKIRAQGEAASKSLASPESDQMAVAELVGPCGNKIKLFDNCSREFLSKLFTAWGVRD